jgi:hypothetical protein
LPGIEKTKIPLAMEKKIDIRMNITRDRLKARISSTQNKRFNTDSIQHSAASMSPSGGDNNVVASAR